MKNKFLTIITLSFFALNLSGCGEIVDAGNTGVKKKLGEIEDVTYPSGLHFYNPFTTTIIEMDNKTQKWESQTQAYTKDVQQVDISFTLNFNLRPEASVEILRSVGERYQDRLLSQIVYSSVKDVIGQWIAVDLVSNRVKAVDQIEMEVSKKLEKHGIAVSNLELTDISFSDKFETAVEAKVVAVQLADKAKNDTVRIQEEADQKVIAAKAEAESMKIKTEALKQSQSLILMEFVNKWDGVMPKIISMGEGNGQILNIPADSFK